MSMRDSQSWSDDIMAIADAVGATYRPVHHPSIAQHLTDDALAETLAEWVETTPIHGCCEGCTELVCHCDDGTCADVAESACTHGRFLCASCSTDECAECRAEGRWTR